MPKKRQPKSKKRTLPECISQTAQGGYKIRVTYQPPGGVRLDRQRTLPPGSSLGQAVDLRDALKAELANQAQVEAEEAACAPTLRSYSERWVEERLTGTNGRRKVKFSTLKSQCSRIDHHILPLLGECRLDRLTRRDIINLLESLEGKVAAGELALTTARNAWTVAKGLLRDACVDHGLTYPGERVYGLQGRLEQPGSRLTDGQLRAYIAYASGLAPRKHSALLAFLPGLRRIEVATQEQADLHLDQEVPYLVVSSSKTASGAGRWVPLPPPTVHALRLQLASIGPHRYVWPGGLHQGKAIHITPGAIYKWFREAARALQISATPHDMRRTYISLCNAAGVREAVLRDVVGHVDQRTTMGYIHTNEEERRQAVRPILQVLQGGQKTS